jgi:Mg/Co/Ni transporter MgtE
MRCGDEDAARKLAKALLAGLGIGMVAAIVIGAPGVVVLIAGGGVAIVALAIRLTVLLSAGSGSSSQRSDCPGRHARSRGHHPGTAAR